MLGKIIGPKARPVRKFFAGDNTDWRKGWTEATVGFSATGGLKFANPCLKLPAPAKLHGFVTAAL